ncbi:DUF6153 family protein [Streptomyces vietnamensis]|uniref:Uncharacterized protein n=1 Tax=Streptomyces vietnamensis TaxID=362257 RepID=A0A0B5I4A2_9ACTN|nr:DUF6153 family protein [Streptomyces vietnamensis]AJF68945.1 hypothetical protein SVTN_36165 [Streptomyces vietnamensis]
MATRQETATWPGRCVLAVVLLFGIVFMHALGHSDEHRAVGVTAHTTAGSHASAPAVEQAAAADDHGASHPAPAHGAGVAALCLAVLGAGIGLLLLWRAARRRLPLGDVSRATERLAYALRAIPPPAPPGSLLARLSLLRI